MQVARVGRQRSCAPVLTHLAQKCMPKSSESVHDGRSSCSATPESESRGSSTSAEFPATMPSGLSNASTDMIMSALARACEFMRLPIKRMEWTHTRAAALLSSTHTRTHEKPRPSSKYSPTRRLRHFLSRRICGRSGRADGADDMNHRQAIGLLLPRGAKFAIVDRSEHQTLWTGSCWRPAHTAFAAPVILPAPTDVDAASM